MLKRYIPFVLALLAGLMLLMSGLGTRAGFWTFRTGFTILKYGAYLGLATSLVTLVYLLIPRLRERNVMLLVVALVIAATAAFVPWNLRRTARGLPGIHDITTDMERPPEFVAVLPLRADAKNPAHYEGDSIAVQQREAYPDIQPVILNVLPNAAFRVAREAAEEMGWEMVAADSVAGRIEATATTTWFGFKDDVVIRIEPAEQGSRIDVRSVSRVGRGDVGANAARIRKFVEKIRD